MPHPGRFVLFRACAETAARGARFTASWLLRSLTERSDPTPRTIHGSQARKLARDTVKIAAKANRRFSGFTCYAALAPHRASNIEDVSYQILLGEKKYFVSTDGGGERQQWFALIREPAGGVDPGATPPTTPLVQQAA